MFWVKAVISGLLIAAASEVARRNPTMGGLIGALPLISVMAMIWLWRGDSDAVQLGAYSRATFFFVLPSLPMFLLIPALLKAGWRFWPALLSGCLLTLGLYGLMLWLLQKLGMAL